MARSISESFMNRFMDKNDLLPVLEYVKADNSLDLEMRGNYVSIYYRGGSVLRIFEDKDHYDCIDPRYMPEARIPQFSLDNIHAYLTEAKHIMDIYTTNVKNHLGEKDIQQMIIKENNYSCNSFDTDYFIIDSEYQNGDKRFDLVALEWESTPAAHKLAKTAIPRLFIIEVKQGYKSIRSTQSVKDDKTTESPGLRIHQDDFHDFVSDRDRVQNFQNDMLNLFRQKRILGLIPGFKLGDNADKYKDITQIQPKVEFACVLANYKTQSTQLRLELQEMEDCLFFNSSFMGYGLYKSSLMDKAALEKELCR